MKVTLKNSFLKERQDIISKKAINYQWDALNGLNIDGESNNAIRNLKIAAGIIGGNYIGPVFQDSDIAKWIEAASYYLEKYSDDKVTENVDYVIDLISKIQMDDGYFNSCIQMHDINLRFTDLYSDHELYCLGHLIEAAIAYYKTTNKKKLLNIVCKYVDLIESYFGSENTKCNGYPGHEEIELALIKLYELTNNKKYFDIAKYFVMQRGKKPNYFIEEIKKNENMPKRYEWQREIKLPKTDTEKIKLLKSYQAHIPVKEQKKAVGHSVRATYLYCAMADIAKLDNDDEMLSACKRIWENVTTKQMYITGGIGTNKDDERFSIDYDLPNDVAYTETCASIGLFLWAYRMFNVEQKSEYINIMEKTLYNGILSGVSLDATKYFYVNPLEVWPDVAKDREDHSHVKTKRQGWYGCCCCPTNLSRLMISIEKYVYTKINETIYINLYTSSEVKLIDDDIELSILQKTQYPWKGIVDFEINSNKEYTAAFRIPDWCSEYSVYINGKKIKKLVFIDGYIYIKRVWNNDKLLIDLDMPILKVYSNPLVRNNAGKVALQKGPLIYCLEETDNGRLLSDIKIPQNSLIENYFDKDLLGGIMILTGEAKRTDFSEFNAPLYNVNKYNLKDFKFKAIPYFAWANRQVGEMIVWSNEL